MAHCYGAMGLWRSKIKKITIQIVILLRMVLTVVVGSMNVMMCMKHGELESELAYIYFSALTMVP